MSHERPAPAPAPDLTSARANPRRGRGGREEERVVSNFNSGLGGRKKKTGFAVLTLNPDRSSPVPLPYIRSSDVIHQRASPHRPNTTLNLLGRKPSGNHGRVEEMPSEYRWNLCAVHLVFEGGFLSGIFFFSSSSSFLSSSRAPLSTYLRCAITR